MMFFLPKESRFMNTIFQPEYQIVMPWLNGLPPAVQEGTPNRNTQQGA